MWTVWCICLTVIVSPLCLKNYQYSVGWGFKLYSLTHSSLHQFCSLLCVSMCLCLCIDRKLTQMLELGNFQMNTSMNKVCAVCYAVMKLINDILIQNAVWVYVRTKDFCDFRGGLVVTEAAWVLCDLFMKPGRWVEKCSMLQKIHTSISLSQHCFVVYNHFQSRLNYLEIFMWSECLTLMCSCSCYSMNSTGLTSGIESCSDWWSKCLCTRLSGWLLCTQTHFSPKHICVPLSGTCCTYRGTDSPHVVTGLSSCPAAWNRVPGPVRNTNATEVFFRH